MTAWEQMTVMELKNICREAGLPQTGPKTELVERIVQYRGDDGEVKAGTGPRGTPPAKRPNVSSSPLQELDGMSDAEPIDDTAKHSKEKLFPPVPTFPGAGEKAPTQTAGGALPLTTDNLALLLSSTISSELAPIKQYMSDMSRDLSQLRISTEKQLTNLQQKFDSADIRISRLEKLWETSSIRSAEEDDAWTKKLDEMRADIEKIKYGPTPQPGDQRSLTAVIGGLHALADQTKATKWLQDKLKELAAPQPIEVYTKGKEFKGLIFAKFTTTADRDLAIGVIRSLAEHVWAKKDMAVQARAKERYLFMLKKLLVSWGFERTSVWIDTSKCSLDVGPDEVLTVRLNKDGNKIECDWRGTWALWQELHTSSELIEIQTTVDKMLATTSISKGKGKGKASAGAASASA
jgi:hypothetical protein